MIKVRDSRMLEGPPDNSKIPHISLGKLFMKYLKEQRKDHVVLIDGNSNKEITSRQLLEQSIKIAVGLRKLGVVSGDTVGIIKENSVEYIAFTIAALYVGAAVCAGNPSWTLRELTKYFQNVKPKLVFCSEVVLEHVWYLKSLFGYTEFILTYARNKYGLSTIFELIEECNQDIDKFEAVDVNPEEHVAFILASSGTTGVPKWVMITHSNFRYSELYYEDPEFYGISKNDITLVVCPLYHVYGIHVAISGIWFDAKTIILQKFIPEQFLKAIQDHKVNKLFLVPTLAVFIAKSALVEKYDMSSVKEVFCGSSTLKKDVQKIAKRRLNVKRFRQVYGCTECSGLVLCELRSQMKCGSVGKVVNCTVVKVRDLNTHEVLGPHQTGEICVKSPCCAKGYLNDEKLMAESLDKDGFYTTGDAAYYDEDGFFYIVDRVKELIKYKSFQVSPSELEGILLCHPSIKEAAVVGTPDERAGELPTAFVVKEAGSKLTEEEIIEFVAAQVAPLKRLSGGVRFVDSLPKTPSGKIIRRELKEMCGK